MIEVVATTLLLAALSSEQHEPKVLDLTGDQPLSLREARKLKRWWSGGDWSADIRQVRPRRFAVSATRVKGNAPPVARYNVYPRGKALTP